MTNSKLFSNSCPVCEGDLQFDVGLDGKTLKCVQCSRSITRRQAAEMLASIRLGRSAEKAEQSVSRAFRRAA